MAKRPHPSGATNNPHDGPWSSCDRCGFIYNLNRLQFQYDFNGGSTPVNLGVLCCSKCLDGLNYQKKLLILPPDPKPIMNTRPEQYVVDETNWLTAEDGTVLTTETGDPITPSIPSPDDDANSSDLTTDLPT